MGKQGKKREVPLFQDTCEVCEMRLYHLTEKEHDKGVITHLQKHVEDGELTKQKMVKILSYKEN